MKTSETLLTAMDLIALPENWTKGAFGRDANSRSVGSRGTNVCKWCSIGAINHVTVENGNNYKAKNYLRSVIEGGEGVESYNDARSTKHEDVMNMFMAATFTALSQGD